MRALSKRLLKMISSRDLKVWENYKIERNLEELIHPPLPRLGMDVISRTIPAADREIPVRLFVPRSSPFREEPLSSELLLFFHGGGWVSGSVKSYDSVCAYMARQTQRRVVSVEYRLAPEHPFPAGPEDCYFALQYIAAHAAEWDTTADKITLVGDSAGGNIVAGISQMARDRKGQPPAGQILIYPAVDCDHSAQSPYPSVQENGDSYILTSKRIEDYLSLYRNHPEDDNNPYFAPIRAANLRQQPDTLIITAEFDPLRDEAEYYGKRLQAAGNEVVTHRVMDALHGFLSSGIFYSQTQETYQYIHAFLNRHDQPAEWKALLEHKQ